MKSEHVVAVISKSTRLLGRVAWMACVVGLIGVGAGCRAPRPPEARPPDRLAAEEARLAGDLHRLSPTVAKAEANRVARVIVRTVEDARLASRLEGGAVHRNLAVNLGLHDWGLCWHWTELLGHRLQQENLRTLRLRWGCAHAGSTLREHNAVVITASNQTFDQGIVIDPWRHGGLLTWIRVTDDRYPWSHEPWSENRWNRPPTAPVTP
jgi:hypothetical protein